MIGRNISQYSIQDKLGAGGMGEVYRAVDNRRERDVALKVLPPGTHADAQARVRLMAEARTASALNHPNICTIYEVGEAHGQTFIAMEYVPGRTLNTLISTQGLAADSVLHY